MDPGADDPLKPLLPMQGSEAVSWAGGEDDAALRESEGRLRFALEKSRIGAWEVDVATRTAQHSALVDQIFGYAPHEVSQWTSERFLSHVHPDDRDAVAEAFRSAVSQRAEWNFECRIVTRAGVVRWIWVAGECIVSQVSGALRMTGVIQDVTERHRGEAVRVARSEVLDQIVANRPLRSILEDVARRLEALDADMRVSIQLVDPQAKCLRLAAAPSLAPSFVQGIAQLPIAEGVGSCGTAAFLGESVVVVDVERSPHFQSFMGICRRERVQACWSVPFKDEKGLVLGVVGVYHGSARTPALGDLEMVGEFARFAALAVQKLRAAEALKQAAAVFESTRDGVLITDLAPRIVAVNRAYTEITGFSAEEVVGRNPAVLRSGRHDESFYQAMWAQLLETGSWQGEVWNRRKTGELYPQWLSISTVPDEHGLPRHYVGVFTDISQLRQSEEQLQHLAHHDPLTGLPNRLLAQSRLQHAIERSERHGFQVAAVYLDLDRFKNVNDSLGHPVGDELLVLLAQRLRGRLREEDTLARLGGDEFLLVLESINAPRQASTVAQALIDALAQPFTLSGGQEIFIGMSVGISLCPGDASSVTELIQHADLAMYQAKRSGRNTFRFHTDALSVAASERLEMETRLRRALSAGEFVLHYQPLIDARNGSPAGVEALVRWQPPGEPLVPPGRFIPIAEETGLIVPLGEWVLRTACAQAQAWLQAGLPPRVMAVNLSVRQFHCGDLVAVVRQVLVDTGLPAHLLELELTESMFLEHAEQAIATLHALKALGVRLAIDDFGTGYSSLAYLKRFPIDKLKIDQSFVRGLADDANDREIAATIIAMARVFKLEVLAEGVETAQQIEFLRGHGCDFYQGFYFHRPAPLGQIEPWLVAAPELWPKDPAGGRAG